MSCAGLVPVLALAERRGLRELLDSRLRLAATSGANATAKVLALVAGMLAGSMRRLFERVRAPSTLGMFLRAFTFGHVRALDGIAPRLPARLAGATRSWAGPTNWCSWTSMTPCLGAGDRRGSITPRRNELRARSGQAARRRPGHRASAPR